MTAHHQIEHESKLIITFWDDNTADNNFIDALKCYQEKIKKQTDLCSYNEMVDFSRVSFIRINLKEIMTLASIASKSDSDTHKTKLALIVNSNMAFSFGKMYKAYRNLEPKNNKEVEVFKKRSLALDWINKE